MRKLICYILNHPFPPFLSCRKGWIYFIRMIFILDVLANVTQLFPLFTNDEFHKPLVVSGYIFVFFGNYALLYLILSHFFPAHYKHESWTVKKELYVLMLYIPLTACLSFLYARLTVQGFKLDLSSFIEVQKYNLMLSLVSIPAFGLFVENRLNPLKIARRKRLKESPLKLSEKKCREIMQQLNEVIKNEKLYISNKCCEQLVAEHTGIPLHYISYAINHLTNGNFNDFINKYRV